MRQEVTEFNVSYHTCTLQPVTDSGMPQQDSSGLRTPLVELKEIFSPLREAQLESVVRHGNATLCGPAIATLALLTFGWSEAKNLGERFKTARQATDRLFPNAAVASTHASVMVALRSCGKRLLAKVRVHIVAKLQTQGDWLFLGRPTFSVDGSQFAVLGTKANLAHFAAASRKSKAAYKNAADYAKAKTTQIAVSMCVHLTTGLPFLWKTGGSTDSERGLLLDMLEHLPKESRLVMDAYYFGYQFWNQLIDRGFTFVVRAGKNIEVLDSLRASGNVKCRGDLVYYWPQNAIDAGGPPIMLRLVEVMVGRKKMFLLTNELTLEDHRLATLYAKRWGVEVFLGRSSRATSEPS